MDRRRFIGASLTGLTGAAAAGAGIRAEGETPAVLPAARRRDAGEMRMVVGHQHDHSPNTLRALAALGVTRICSNLTSPRMDDNWSVDGLTRFRRHVESYGVTLAMMPLPMSSLPIDQVENPNILLGKSPERDHEIENIRQMIRNAGKAGIPSLKYNLTLLGIVRSGVKIGRGGAQDNAFVYADMLPKLQQMGDTPAGDVSSEEMWERITYFLQRVVPVAEEAKVRILCHPNDPGLPRGQAFRGVHCALDSVAGLKRFVQTVSSPYHGLNFCQGTISEMLDDPGKEIFDVIRWFGSRGKIFNVHFRNIRGGYLNFQETFPDEGSVDMIRALRTYQEVGYAGMIMPDHVPLIEGDPDKARAFAFCWGYIQALLQQLRSESGARA